MITIEQCRAARGLLGWTQQDLADASGLSKTAINNFEKRHSDIKAESLRAIRIAFEEAGIEFQDDNGLRQRKDKVSIFQSEDSFDLLLADITQTLGTKGGEILILSGEPCLKIETLRSQLNRQGIKTHQQETDGMTTLIYGTKLALRLRYGSMIVIIDSPGASEAERGRFTADTVKKAAALQTLK